MKITRLDRDTFYSAIYYALTEDSWYDSMKFKAVEQLPIRIKLDYIKSKHREIRSNKKGIYKFVFRPKYRWYLIRHWVLVCVFKLLCAIDKDAPKDMTISMEELLSSLIFQFEIAYKYLEQD